MKLNKKDLMYGLLFCIIFIISILYLKNSINTQFPPHRDEYESTTLVKDWADNKLESNLVDYNSAFAIHQGYVLKSFIPMLYYKIFHQDLLSSTRVSGYILLTIIFLGSFIAYKKLNYSSLFLLMFLIVLFLFLNKNIGFSRLGSFEETQIDSMAFLFLLLALIPLTHKVQKPLFLFIVGILLGINFSLSYFAIPILFSTILLHIKEILIKIKNKISLKKYYKNYIYGITGFFIGIIPWIILTLKTHFMNLSYRGMNMISINKNNLANTIKMAVYNNEIIQRYPKFLSLLFYISFIVSLYLLLKNYFSLNKKEDVQSLKSNYYNIKLREYSTLSFFIFLIFVPISIVANTTKGILLFEYVLQIIPSSIFIISTTLISLRKKKLPKKINLISTIIFIAIFISMNTSAFHNSETKYSFEDNLYTTPEDKFYNHGLYVSLYKNTNEILEFCNSTKNDALKKHCLYGLITYNIDKSNMETINAINSIKQEDIDWLYSHLVYWFYWNRLDVVQGVNFEQYPLLDKINARNKTKIKEVFKIRGMCIYKLNQEIQVTNISSNEYFKYLNSSNINFEKECSIAKCMNEIFRPGMNQYKEFKFLNSSEKKIFFNKKGCKEALDFYAKDFKEIYGVDIY